MKVKFYSDPGHGWAAVKRKLLIELGIINNITSFSYQKGNTVYLEEDLDLNTFLHALHAVKNESVIYKVKQTSRPHYIRNYDSFKA